MAWYSVKDEVGVIKPQANFHIGLGGDSMNTGWVPMLALEAMFS